MNKRNNYIASGIVTLLVVAVLVMTGPAHALTLGLEGFKNTPYEIGEIVSFEGKISVEDSEIVDMQNISLVVNDEVVCVFDINGNLLSECSGIGISLIDNSLNFGYGYGFNEFIANWSGSDRSSNAGNYEGNEYGYGYGFNGGELVYNISIQTPQDYFKIPGNNDLQLVLNSGDDEFNSRIEKIVIKPNNGNSNGNNGNNGNNNGNGKKP